MSLSLQPEIFGTIQPQPATPTVVVLTPANRPGHMNVFITNNSDTYKDQVRVQLRPANTPLDAKQFILYDTPIISGHTVTISQVFLNVGDQVVVYSQLGACAFTVTGTAFVTS